MEEGRGAFRPLFACVEPEGHFKSDASLFVCGDPDGGATTRHAFHHLLRVISSHFPPFVLTFSPLRHGKTGSPSPPPPPPLSNLPSWPRLMMLVFSPDGPGKGKHSYPSLLALNGLNETPPPNFLSNPPPPRVITIISDRFTNLLSSLVSCEQPMRKRGKACSEERRERFNRNENGAERWRDPFIRAISGI